MLVYIHNVLLLCSLLMWASIIKSKHHTDANASMILLNNMEGRVCTVI